MLSKFLKYAAASVISFLVSLPISVIASLMLSTFTFLQSSQSTYFKSLNLVGFIISLVFTVTLFVLVFNLIATTVFKLNTGNYKKAYKIAIIASFGVYFGGVFLARYMSQNNSRLGHVYGAESRNYFNKISHNFYVIPDTNTQYNLVNRVHENTIDKTLESTYTDVATGKDFNIIEWHSKSASTHKCSAHLTNPCQDIESDIGQMNCNISISQAVCQRAVEGSYMLSVESYKLSAQSLLNATNSLTAKAPKDIKLTK